VFVEQCICLKASAIDLIVIWGTEKCVAFGAMLVCMMYNSSAFRLGRAVWLSLFLLLL
jgi:hypothetical protein